MFFNNISKILKTCFIQTLLSISIIHSSKLVSNKWYVSNVSTVTTMDMLCSYEIHNQ